MLEERPLATVDGGGPKSTGWLKTKLLMRLSFSTTSARQQDKFHSSLQKSSEGIEERDEPEQVSVSMICQCQRRLQPLRPSALDLRIH